MSTQLSIQKTIVPKPTKADIINAMVARAEVLHNIEAQKLNDERSKLTAEIAKEAKKAVTKALIDAAEISIRGGSNPRVEVEVTVSNEKIKQLIQKHSAVGYMRPFDEPATRRKIRDGMSEGRGEAVKSILGSPEAVAAIDKKLAEIV